MITTKREGFDCIIRPAPEGAGRTTPEQTGHHPLKIPSYRYKEFEDHSSSARKSFGYQVKPHLPPAKHPFPQNPTMFPDE